MIILAISQYISQLAIKEPHWEEGKIFLHNNKTIYLTNIHWRISFKIIIDEEV